jgi:PAS domain S-box-containing protein
MEYRFLGRLLRRWRFSRSGALLLCVLILVAAPSFCAGPPRPVEQALKLLMLFNGDKDSPAFTVFQNGLRARMEQELNAPVWIYEESFDEAWLGQSRSYERTMESFLRDKYAKRGIDVVVPIGEYPLKYVQGRRKTLFPASKLMYVVWRSPQSSIPDATGMILRLDLGPTLRVALAQNPGTHHVLLIAGATALDRGMAQLMLSSGVKYLHENHNDQVDLKILSPGTFAENRSTLAALPADTLTIVVSYYGDSAGQVFVPARILPVLSTTTNRPMYAWANPLFGPGLVGGSFMDFEATGAAFGDLILRVVHGEKPGTIPEVEVSLQRKMFDWRQMKRWGIGMDKVPAGSTVMNREFTVWELYKWRFIGLFGLVIVEGVLLVGLVRLALAQRRHVKQLARQSALAALVAELAAAFIGLPGEKVDAESERSFQRLLEFVDIDRVSLFEFSAEKTQLRLLCARSSIGVEQPPAIFDLHQYPWTATHILRGIPIVASHLDQLPEEAGALREVLRARGVRSFAAFPLQQHGSTFATLIFTTIQNECLWSPELVRSLQTIADIFGSALHRKYAEETASDSQNRLGSIVESAMDAIIAVDGQQHIVVFNAAAEKIFGCPMAKALGQPIDRFIPNRFRAQHHAHISQFAGTGVTNRAMGTLGALWALRANGEEFPIEASISQVKANGPNLFTAIIRDITERVKAEEAMRETEGRFRLVANTAPVLIWMAGPDKLCTYFNQPWLDFTGRRLEDELGNGWAKGVHPDDLEECLATYTQAFDRRQPFRMEYRLRGHDGVFRWVLDIGVPRINADGSFAGYIGSCVDLTERKHAEEALRESEELKASILDSLSNHVVVVDAMGIVVDVNDPGFDFSASTPLLHIREGTNYLDLCRSGARKNAPEGAAALDGIQAVFDGKRDYFEMEYIVHSAPGKPCLLMSVTPLKGHDHGVVISHQDITERRRHELAIQDLSGRLINAQEQERSRIARELHDDINQQVAMLAIELQQLQGFLPAGFSEGREKVQALWEKTNLLSTEIQHLSHQLHSAKLEHLGIIAALRGLCSEFSEQHKIETDFQFRQIPQNLDSDISLTLFRVAQESLHNVAKHSHAKKVRVELIGMADKVLVRVSDDGVGFTANGTRTGLGMISMNERTRLLGGTFTASSIPSLGTQVEAAIPLSSRTAAVNRTLRLVQTGRKAG